MLNSSCSFESSAGLRDHPAATQANLAERLCSVSCLFQFCSPSLSIKRGTQRCQPGHARSHSPFACFSSVLHWPPTQLGRTLTPNELRNVFGDWGVDECCIDYGWCDGLAQSCSTWEDEAGCITSTQVDLTAGNKETCQPYFENTSCLEAANKYACKTITACAWDPDSGDCKLSQFYFTETEVPEFCSDTHCD